MRNNYEKYTTHCDYCENQVEEKELNGFCVEIGYSREATSGWGRRRDFIPKHAVEICGVCFDKVKLESEKLSELIKQLKSV